MTAEAPDVQVSPMDAAVEDVLQAVYRGEPAVVVASPPGAGKTGLVERVATLCADRGDRVAIACQTGAQCLDLVRRFIVSYPDVQFTYLVKHGWTAPDDITAAANVLVVSKAAEIPDTPGVTVGTAAKWEYVSLEEPFDLLIVDEAWQLPDYVFVQIVGIGTRFLLVGDPGQIAPVITADVRRWSHLADGPHQPAPVALGHRRPNDVVQLDLPATRRLGPLTVEVIQPVFYPKLPFRSVRANRAVGCESSPQNHAERLLDSVTGSEIAVGVLPAGVYGIADEFMARTAADVIRAALDKGYVESGGGRRPLTGSDVGVVCAHVAQVASVQAALGQALRDVQVDTAERWQGQETEFMVVWHPMSGRLEASDFARDAGRLCVMLSRHKAGCVVLWRADAPDVLVRGGTGTRTLGDGSDLAYEGWLANSTLFSVLSERAINLAE